MTTFQRKNGIYVPTDLTVKANNIFKANTTSVKQSGVFKSVSTRVKPSNDHFATFKLAAGSGSLVINTYGGRTRAELWDKGVRVSQWTSIASGTALAIPSSTSTERELRVFNVAGATPANATSMVRFNGNALISEIISVDCGLHPAAEYPRATSTILTKVENYLPPNCTSLSSAFNGCVKLNCDLDKWDTSNVTNMNQTFYNANAFAGSVEGWNVEKVTTMYYMFLNNLVFNSTMNSWNPKNCTDFYAMFNNCQKFNQPLNHWDVSKGTIFVEMFTSCSIFNQPLNNWDTSLATSMDRMFEKASIFDKDISMWDVTNVATWANFRRISALSTAFTPAKFR